MISGMRALWLPFALLAVSLAQTPAGIALINSGPPMRVTFACTDEDISYAGLSCTVDEPCPVYLELTDVSAVGNRVFTSGNIHSETTTLYTVLLASEDAGKTWQEPFERVRGAALERIQFVDFENGWIGGQVVYPLPQDPFLLITSDGGKSWRRRPVFAETRVGSVQQFWFSSKTAGALVIDRAQSGEASRYELYESPNGGETWMIREQSEKPIRLKHGNPPDSGWRIRADAASKSFHLERRQGDRWHSMAAFLVDAGSCKPQERKPAPEPEIAPPAVPEAVPAPKPPPTPARPPSLKRPPKG